VVAGGPSPTALTARDSSRFRIVPTGRVDGVLFDLLTAVMNSLEVWSAAAGDRKRGLEWRDAATRRMVASRSYLPYEDLVAEATADVGLPPSAASRLFDRWPQMAPWPDAAGLSVLELPYGFVTNCSSRLAGIAAGRSRLKPAFTLASEEAGWYKPDARIYH
jgi:2-haloacid dehalogenase